MVKTKADNNHLQFENSKAELRTKCRSIGEQVKKVEHLLQLISVLELPEHVAVNIKQIDCMLSSIDKQLSRKKMKVSIFGETSSGKSTTANALIGKDLLASGMADTTNCFLEIQIMKETFYNNSYFVVCDGVDDVGTKNQKHFLDKRGIEQLEDMSSAGSESTLGASKVIRIFLKPQDVNVSLLARDIQIMDCPGISSCRELGDKVKKFCADSDVHIFVVSSKAVMTPEAMEHFFEVGKRLPKPDVIIAFTHWDLSVNERHPERVKVRHVDKAFELLKKLGTVEGREEAEQRCFFISSTEAKNIAVDNGNALTVEGWQDRQSSFQQFQNKIKERASIRGVKAKLELHRQALNKAEEQLITNTRELLESARTRRMVSDDTIKVLTEKNCVLDEGQRRFNNEHMKTLKDGLHENLCQQILDCYYAEKKRLLDLVEELSRDGENDDVNELRERAEDTARTWFNDLQTTVEREVQTLLRDYVNDITKCFHEEFLPLVDGLRMHPQVAAFELHLNHEIADSLVSTIQPVTKSCCWLCPSVVCSFWRKVWMRFDRELQKKSQWSDALLKDVNSKTTAYLQGFLDGLKEVFSEKIKNIRVDIERKQNEVRENSSKLQALMLRLDEIISENDNTYNGLAHNLTGP